MVYINLLAFFIIGFLFYQKQNKNSTLGGSISVAKAFWLFFAIHTWLFLIPILIFSVDLPFGYKVVWSIFSGWFWLRSILEMIMMYKTKNWSPIYGISHDISCLLILFLGTFYYYVDFIHSNPFLLLFHLVLILSLLLETYYAYEFFKIVGEGTKGEKAIWFADSENLRFKRVVHITHIFNYVMIMGILSIIYYVEFIS